MWQHPLFLPQDPCVFLTSHLVFKTGSHSKNKTSVLGNVVHVLSKELKRG